ncbi:MAG: shikimate kinase, partial [Planctomycetota bacterium]
DPLTLKRCGETDVHTVVDRCGWETFRAHERDALADVLGRSAHVIGLGGGTPTHPPSRELLDSAAASGRLRLVYLRTKPETLAGRMQSTPDRPSLTGADPFDEIAALFDARDPLYLELAHAVVETDGLTLDESVGLAAVSV